MSFTLSQIFGEQLLRLGSKHKNLVVLDTDLSTMSKTHLFAKNFADRHFYFGLAEQNLVASSAGFAIRGKLPFVCSDALFLTGRAYTQIRNMICYPNFNVKFVGLDAGLALGKDGAVMHALEDVALMRSIPNMKIYSPCDAEELKFMMQEMVHGFGPMYLRLAAGPLESVYEENKYHNRSGEVDVLKNGKEICIFTTGTLVMNALKVAEILKDEVSIKVVNVSTIKPLDEKGVLAAASDVRLAVSMEDHFVTCGLGSALSGIFSEKYPMRFYRIGVKDFSQSGSKEDLYAKHGLDVDSIVRQLKVLWQKHF